MTSLGKGLLWVSAFWLCCLAGLEFARLQLFVPGSFSPLAASTYSLGLFLALGLLTWPLRTAPVFLPILTAWICVAGLPFGQAPFVSSLSLIVLASGFQVVNRGRSGWLSWLATIGPAACYLAFPSPWRFWVPFFLCATAVELRVLWIKECDHYLLARSRARKADRGYRAELLWRGLTELYLACTPEHGSSFANQVFEGCDQIVRDHGGRLVRGGLQRALYSFPTREELEACAESLAAYGRSVNNVLSSASLPTISQVFVVEETHLEPANPTPATYPVAQAF